MSPHDLETVLAAGNPLARAVCLTVAAVVAGGLLVIDARAWPLTVRQRLGLGLAVVVGALVGAWIPPLLAGGMVGTLASGPGPWPRSVLGGLVGGFAGAAAYKKWLRIDWDTSDGFARATAACMTLGRLGCHASHCCLGVVAPDPRFGIDFGDGTARLPIQLIEASALAGLFALVNHWHVRDLLPHRRLFLYMALYGALRFVLEFGREPLDARWHGLGHFQWMALGLVAFGLWQCARRSRLARGRTSLAGGTVS